MTKDLRETRVFENVATCGICGCVIDLDNDWHRDTHDNGIVCEDCHGNNYIVCYNCDESVNIYNDTYYSDGWDYYCEDCAPARIKHPNLIEYYHDGHDGRYNHILKATDTDSSFTIGFELERDGYCDNDVLMNADAMADLKDRGLVHYETDSSLSSGGVECISQPFTLRWLNENETTFREIIHVMADNNGSYHEGTSFHIHIGRNAFLTDTALAKVCYFYRAFPKAVLALANRPFNEWAGKIRGTLLNTAKGYHHDDRYQAINLNNSNTVEFRLMGGSEDADELLRWIRFNCQLIAQANEIGWAFAGNIECWLDGFSDEVIAGMARNGGLTDYLGETIAPYEVKARIQLWDGIHANWYAVTQFDSEDSYRTFDSIEDVERYSKMLVRDILKLDMSKCKFTSNEFSIEIYNNETGLYMLDGHIRKTNLLNALVD